MKTNALLIAALTGLSGLSLAETFPTTGNHVIPLETGVDLNAHRLDLVTKAQKFVYLKTFIINRDKSEAPVYEALCERARAGVDVRLIVDDIGRRSGGNPIKKKKGEFSIAWFKSCGIRFERYARPMWGPVDFALYNQHDKLIVSENAAIMGGTNYSRDYSDHARDSKLWYDFDIYLEGPAVCSVQKIFNISWRNAYAQEYVGIKKLATRAHKRKVEARFSPETLVDECVRPEARGTKAVTVIWNDPKFSKERPFVDYINDSVDEVLKSDGKFINLYAPYFVPNKKVVRKLSEAAERGVKVRIITNSKTSIDKEAFPAYVAMLMKVRPLIKSGVEMYLWNPSTIEGSGLEKDNIFHKKGGCFGSLNCFVGSHNLDVRGDKYSSELMAVLSDEETVSGLNLNFEEDLKLTVPMEEADRKQLLKEASIPQKILAKIGAWAM